MNDGPSLLSSIEQKSKLWRPFYTVQPMAEPKGLVIQSNFEDLGSTTVGDSDMEQWPKEAVFCHNDLTPRNLILQPTGSAGGITEYKLAAILDWELAGFYPPSYQLSLQDTYLSGTNRHLSFYLLLKERMKDITPRSPSQGALLRAIELIFESQQRRLSKGTNIPAHIRKRFREVMGLSRDKDPYVPGRLEMRRGGGFTTQVFAGRCSATRGCLLPGVALLDRVHGRRAGDRAGVRRRSGAQGRIHADRRRTAGRDRLLPSAQRVSGGSRTPARTRLHGRDRRRSRVRADGGGDGRALRGNQSRIRHLPRCYASTPGHFWSASPRLTLGSTWWPRSHGRGCSRVKISIARVR